MDSLGLENVRNVSPKPLALYAGACGIAENEIPCDFLGGCGRGLVGAKKLRFGVLSLSQLSCRGHASAAGKSPSFVLLLFFYGDLNWWPSFPEWSTLIPKMLSVFFKRNYSQYHLITSPSLFLSFFMAYSITLLTSLAGFVAKIIFDDLRGINVDRTRVRSSYQIPENPGSIWFNWYFLWLPYFQKNKHFRILFPNIGVIIMFESFLIASSERNLVTSKTLFCDCHNPRASQMFVCTLRHNS